MGLIEHCEKALNEKWRYLWGCYGQIATKTVIDNNIKQYPANASKREYAEGAIGKTRLCDCYGLVKSYLWWTDNKGNPKYNGSQDFNTAAAYSRAKEKGLLADMPEIPGIILYMEGHVGVYIGCGRFIECAGGGKGAIEGEIANGKVVNGSKFIKWFKDCNITYLNTDIKQVLVMFDKTETFKLNCINNNGLHFCKWVELRSVLTFDILNKLPPRILNTNNEEYVSVRNVFEAAGCIVEWKNGVIVVKYNKN